MLIALPLLCIIIACILVGGIVIRKFPQLSLLDIESLPEVREGRKKDEFLKKRIEAIVEKEKKERETRLVPIVAFFRNTQRAFRSYVGHIERILMREDERERATETIEDKQERAGELRTILLAAQELSEEKDFGGAEKKYIAAIRIDNKNTDAYRGLADVYYRQGQFDEARETYMFLLQLSPGDDVACVKLAKLFEEEGKYEKAVEYYQQAILINPNLSQRFAEVAEVLIRLGEHHTALEAIEQAVELEPQNPKYLDMLVETGIMVSDARVAARALEALRMVNPDNQKIPLWKEKISEIAQPVRRFRKRPMPR